MCSAAHLTSPTTPVRQPRQDTISQEMAMSKSNLSLERTAIASRVAGSRTDGNSLPPASGPSAALQGYLAAIKGSDRDAAGPSARSCDATGGGSSSGLGGVTAGTRWGGWGGGVGAGDGGDEDGNEADDEGEETDEDGGEEGGVKVADADVTAGILPSDDSTTLPRLVPPVPGVASRVEAAHAVAPAGSNPPVSHSAVDAASPAVSLNRSERPALLAPRLQRGVGRRLWQKLRAVFLRGRVD
ncbi:hypothetical protein BDK51DRAFT_44942 [Blyttiomyces helicus]|uniref:Uncharacterized protein n=1 Tax=Blyttiomyces helicus TaxID=388810 RepID=A0A4P9WC32_9FUNG|nr:hypothetical protein BDK51DRAFT_44942 [Blyttiomyces helicus]|eukprot:RKO87896.1 hypothetical protein BDK51DRAFT_44942 [Blyttiomyces helicus]